MGRTGSPTFWAARSRSLIVDEEPSDDNLDRSDGAGPYSGPMIGGGPAGTPSFSMLGWALNEEENVRAYLGRAEDLLRGLTTDFEVIVIDDASTDQTLAV